MAGRAELQRVNGAGERFVLALAEKSGDGLRDALAANVRFRGLTPGRAWEADGSEAVIDVLFGSWFEPTGHIDEVESHDVHDVVDKIAVRYRLKVHNDGGRFVVEQQGILVIDDAGRIADIAIVCSGFQPISEAG